ncbi:trypsin-2-like, partial [Culex pipiens pallens]|uniref:trypsin-2-like n=1 Tax=Culex pipiens pallens TaxID=42434 RepID=UPI0022AB4A97
RTLQRSVPSYVFIRTETRQRCGGAVIDESHIVTLAQCVLDGNFHVFNPRLVRVFAGDLLWFPASATRQMRLASVIYVHPNFKAHTLENDIAICRLQEPFNLPSNHIEQAFRRTRIVGNDHVCQSVGWRTVDGVSLQATIPMPIRDRDVCNHVRYLEPVTERMICAGNLLAQGVAPCPGNIGSVLFCDGEATGLLSFGMNCVTANDPPTFTQIRYFNNWIDQQLTRTDVPLMNWSPLDV